MKTYYDDLEVLESASPEAIKGAYRFLSQRWHPDKNPERADDAQRVAAKLNRAYEVLSDPVRREQYDEWLRQRRNLPAKPALEDQPATKESSPKPAGAADSFIKRAWFSTLFAAALFGVLALGPYQLLTGGVKWHGAVVGFLFWMTVGRYAYIRLFHPEVVQKESGERFDRLVRESASRKTAKTIGIYTFVIFIPLMTLMLMSYGDPVEIAATVSVFLAGAAGLTSWALSGLYLRLVKGVSGGRIK